MSSKKGQEIPSGQMNEMQHIRFMMERRAQIQQKKQQFTSTWKKQAADERQDSKDSLQRRSRQARNQQVPSQQYSNFQLPSTFQFQQQAQQNQIDQNQQFYNQTRNSPNFHAQNTYQSNLFSQQQIQEDEQQNIQCLQQNFDQQNQNDQLQGVQIQKKSQPKQLSFFSQNKKNKDQMDVDSQNSDYIFQQQRNSASESNQQPFLIAQTQQIPQPLENSINNNVFSNQNEQINVQNFQQKKVLKQLKSISHASGESNGEKKQIGFQTERLNPTVELKDENSRRKAFYLQQSQNQESSELFGYGSEGSMEIINIMNPNIKLGQIVNQNMGYEMEKIVSFQDASFNISSSQNSEQQNYDFFLQNNYHLNIQQRQKNQDNFIQLDKNSINKQNNQNDQNFTIIQQQNAPIKKSLFSIEKQNQEDEEMSDDISSNGSDQNIKNMKKQVSLNQIQSVQNIENNQIKKNENIFKRIASNEIEDIQVQEEGIDKYQTVSFNHDSSEKFKKNQLMESKDCDLNNNIFNPYLGNIGSSDDDYDEEEDKQSKASNHNKLRNDNNQSNEVYSKQLQINNYFKTQQNDFVMNEQDNQQKNDNLETNKQKSMSQFSNQRKVRESSPESKQKSIIRKLQNSYNDAGSSESSDFQDDKEDSGDNQVENNKDLLQYKFGQSKENQNMDKQQQSLAYSNEKQFDDENMVEVEEDEESGYDARAKYFNESDFVIANEEDYSTKAADSKTLKTSFQKISICDQDFNRKDSYSQSEQHNQTLFGLTPKIYSRGIIINQQRQNSMFVQPDQKFLFQKQIRFKLDNPNNQKNVDSTFKNSLAMIPKDNTGRHHTMSQKSQAGSGQSNTSQSNKYSESNESKNYQINQNQLMEPQGVYNNDQSNHDDKIMSHQKQGNIIQRHGIEIYNKIFKQEDKQVNNENAQNDYYNTKQPIESQYLKSQESKFYHKPQTSNLNTMIFNANTLDQKLKILNKQQQQKVFQTNLSQLYSSFPNSQSYKDKNNSSQQLTKESFDSNRQFIQDSMKSDNNQQSFLKKQNVLGGGSLLMKSEQKSLKFTQQVNQKIIDDNFNYQTDISFITHQTIQESSQEIAQSSDEQKKLFNNYIEVEKLRVNSSQNTKRQSKEKSYFNKIKTSSQNQSSRSMHQNSELLDDQYKHYQIEQNQVQKQNKLKNFSQNFFPDLINLNQEINEEFMKQFSDVISKKLKKKLKEINNFKELQLQFKRNENLFYEVGGERYQKRTLILSFDDCLLKSSIFKNEFPRNDGMFTFQNLRVYICFRNDLEIFLKTAQQYFEMIAWTSSQEEYSDQIINMVQNKFNFQFDQKLCLKNQFCSEDNDFFVKNIELLTGEGNRSEKDIIIIDNQMSNYTNRLTNGIFLPKYRMDKDQSDAVLMDLLQYLLQFVPTQGQSENIPTDVRQKIKRDFDLVNKFNSQKQTQAFNKILMRTIEESGAGLNGQLDKIKDSQFNLNQFK